MTAAQQVQGLGPAAELMLLAGTVSDPRHRQARVRAVLQREVDWEFLERIALRNRVVPLVLEALLAADPARVPAEVLERLQGYVRRIKHRNLMVLRELVDVTTSFESAGIEVLPYKGMVLAATLYHDLGLRQFRDLDVLVRPAAVPRARDLLLARGYVSQDRLAVAEEEAHLANDCELHFEHPVGRIELELHWQALPRQHNLGFEIDDFWGRLEPLTLAGHPVRTFAPEDLMLILCIHGGEKHRWSRLQMVCDVARLLAARPGLLWDVLMTRADAIGRRETVLLGAFLAWVLLDAPLPPSVVEQFRGANGLLASAGLSRGRAFRLDSGLPTYREWRGYLADQSRRALDRGVRIAGAMGFLSYLRVILTPDWTDRQKFPLPRGLSMLHYVYRPLRLLWRHKTKVLDRV